jgi:hypothetical protein
MNYQVEYKDENRVTSEIEAASPPDAARLFLQQDSEIRWQDFEEVIVAWGLFGKHRESFVVQDLLRSPPVAPKEVAASELHGVLPMTPSPLPKDTAYSLTPQQRQGRAGLLTIFVVFVLLNVVFILVKVKQQGFDDAPRACSRLCANIVLLYAIWIGQRWARWLLVGVLYTGSVVMLVIVFARPHPVLMALLFAYALVGSLVGFDKRISSFLEFQRKRR